MSGAVRFVVLIYLRPGKEAAFRRYEDEANPIIESYGGRIDHMLTPFEVGGDLEMPGEVHLLSFASSEDFERYRADPRTEAIAPLRVESVERAVFIKCRDLETV